MAKSKKREAQPPAAQEDLIYEGLRPTLRSREEVFSTKEGPKPFWPYDKEIDPTAWNGSFPYQLIVLDQNYKRTGEEDWTFTLPFAPQELTLSMPMAINTTPTFGGIVEEHNGAPFRMISFSGTFGINPDRGSGLVVDSYKWAENSVKTASMSASLNEIDPNVTTARPPEGTEWLNTVSDSEYSDPESKLAKSTGYYQFRKLQRFLEKYVSLKRQSSGAGLRLAFANWKDDSVFIVTPVQFEVKRSASSPLEYIYSLQLRAWKRVELAPELDDDEEHEDSALGFSVGYMQSKLEQAQDAKGFFDRALELIYGAQTGYSEALSAISKAQALAREVIGYLKLALDVALFISDLSPELLQKLQEEEKERWKKLIGYEPTLLTKANKLKNKVFSGTPSEISLMGINDIVLKRSQGLSLSPMASVPVDSLELSPTLLELIDQEKQSYRNLTRSDFESMRNELMAAMSEFSSSIGMSTDNQTANEATTQTINSTSSAITTEPTERDYQTLFQMNRLAMVLNGMAVSAKVNLKQITPMDYVAGLATQSSIAFKVPQSKYGVPFPYGYTLEQLARDYLKSPNRWLEIATLNGLQAPYVDEVGVETALVVNGAERTLVVELPEDTTIARGQSITIASDTVPREKRVVQQVEKRGSVTIVRVDGDSDLDKFTVNGKAAIHFYRPNTVNSQMMIYIPSDAEPAQQDYATKSIPGLANLQQVIAAGGVDLQLTNSMDLAVTPDGDCKLAIGLTNLVQRVRIAFATPPGGLLQHPNFGLGLIPGTSTADLNAKAVFDRAQAYFRSDSGFRGVQSVLVKKNGPTLGISLSLGVRGVSQLLPVTLEVKQ